MENEQVETTNVKIITPEKNRIFNIITSKRTELLPILNNNEALFDKYARSFVLSVSKQKFDHCNAASLIYAFTQCCEYNLDPSEGIGYVHFKARGGTLEVEPSYLGWKTLLWRSPLVASAYANVVYEQDKFKRIYSNSPSYIHEPAEIDGDKLRLTYGVVKLKSGEILIECALPSEIEASRALNPNSSSPKSAWQQHPISMAKMVPLRKLARALGLAIKSEDEFVNDQDTTPHVINPTVINPATHDKIEEANEQDVA
jgi:recombinational DNA repair protein RecT